MIAKMLEITLVHLLSVAYERQPLKSQRWRESPRAFRLKDHPSVVIFRDRSLLRERERDEDERSAWHVAEAKRERRRKARRETGRGGRHAVPRGTSERTGIARASLLGFGQCLATANFSSPCGRTTVTFFRSKAERILSSTEASLDASRLGTPCNSATRSVPCRKCRGKFSRNCFLI